MGPIQSGINQTITMAGIARKLYEQSPEYQEKQSQKRYEEGVEALEKERKGADEGVRTELAEKQQELLERRSSELLGSGQYDKWAKAQTRLIYDRRAGERTFGRTPDMYSPYDEGKSGMANDRAENIAQQVKAQNDARQRMFDQLKGVSMVSQAYLASKGYQGGVKINESTKSDKE